MGRSSGLAKPMILHILASYTVRQKRDQKNSAATLEQFRNWCRPERQAFSWFSSKENHTSPSLSGHSNCETALDPLPALLPRQHGRQVPQFGLHFGGIGHSIGDFLAKEFAIPLAKPVNGHLERSF